MRIALIGMIERARPELTQAAVDAGHVLEIHDGQVGGRGAQTLERMVARSDVVVIAVGINSHGGALIAKDIARRRGTPSVFIRKPSVSALIRAITAATPARTG